MSFEDFNPTDIEGFSLRDKNTLKLNIRYACLMACPNCFRRYDLLAQNPEYLCFNPEDVHDQKNGGKNE